MHKNKAAQPTQRSPVLLTSGAVFRVVGKKTQKHRKIKWKGHKTEDSFLQGRLDYPRESERTYLRSRTPLASQFCRSSGENEPSSGRRAGGCLLNSPARRCRPLIHLPSADADTQQHVLRGGRWGDNRSKCWEVGALAQSSWDGPSQAGVLCSAPSLSQLLPPPALSCSLSRAHSSAELSRVGNLGISGWSSCPSVWFALGTQGAGKEARGC